MLLEKRRADFRTPALLCNPSHFASPEMFNNKLQVMHDCTIILRFLNHHAGFTLKRSIKFSRFSNCLRQSGAKVTNMSSRSYKLKSG